MAIQFALGAFGLMGVVLAVVEGAEGISRRGR
jgi:Flp pilus assembly protein TadG